MTGGNNWGTRRSLMAATASLSSNHGFNNNYGNGIGNGNGNQGNGKVFGGGNIRTQQPVNNWQRGTYVCAYATLYLISSALR